MKPYNYSDECVQKIFVDIPKQSLDSEHGVRLFFGYKDGDVNNPPRFNMLSYDTPHMFVCGWLNCGKSNLLDVLQRSFEYMYAEDELTCDRINFTIPEMKRANELMTQAVQEVQRRLDILTKSDCVSFREYERRGENNEIEDYAPLHRKIIIMNDISAHMWANPEVETSVYHILRYGRATGVHLILADNSCSCLDILPQGSIQLFAVMRSSEEDSVQILGDSRATELETGWVYIQKRISNIRLPAIRYQVPIAD